MVQRLTGGDAKVLAEMVKEESIGRLGEPEGIAAVLWLCSPAASFVVSHALLVDGGYRVGVTCLQGAGRAEPL